MPHYFVTVEFFVEADSAEEASDKMENRFENEEVQVLEVRRDTDLDEDEENEMPEAVFRWTKEMDDEDKNEGTDDSVDTCPVCGSTDVTEFQPDDQDGVGLQCKKCEHIWYDTLQD